MTQAELKALQDSQTKALEKALSPYLEEMVHLFKGMVENGAANKNVRRSVVEFQYPEDSQSVVVEGEVKTESTVVDMPLLIEAVKNLHRESTAAIEELRKEFVKSQEAQPIDVKNIAEAKTDTKAIEAELKKQAEVSAKLIKLMEKIAAKEINVEVKAPAQRTDMQWPTKAKDALAVRLVDKRGEKFYDAIASFFGAGGGGGSSSGGEKPQLDIIGLNTGGYSYYAYAQPGTLLAQAKWRVMRVKGSPFSKRFAGGTADFKFAATDMPSLDYGD